jgi:signal transduction histidine kinase
MVAVDENLVVRAISPSAEEFLETAAGKIVGRDIRDCGLLEQDGLTRLENTLQEGLEHKGACRLPGNGENKPALTMQTKRLIDHEGKTIGAVLLFEASGRRAGAENVIKNEKLELIRQMAVGIAHHVRNPLTAVRGFIQIMQEKTGGESFPGFFEFSSIALKELDRVNEVIGKLLHLSGSSDTRRETVNIAVLLDNVHAFIRGRAALSGILVEKDIPPELASPCLDVVQIIHALFKLLDNAIESMPDGGRLLLRAYDLPEESKVCIEISDTGTGIPPENLVNIFNPFFSSREDGMGFGLALANRVVYDHGGEIKVVSEEGKGSTFSVYLPVKS